MSSARPQSTAARSATAARSRRLSITVYIGVRGPRREVRSPVARDEAERALPGVLGLRRELLLLAVEERVRRSGIRDDLVLGAGGVQGGLERRDLVGADRMVVAGHQREERHLDLSRPVGRPRLAVALARHPVEADRARDAVSVGRREPGVAPAEAEADDENARGAE